MSVSFNGVTFPLAHTEPGEIPTRNKVVEFAGTDGVEILPMGRSAREIVVSGVSSGGSPSRGTLEALADDEDHTLSVEGDSFGHCRCIGVGPFQYVTALPDGLRMYFKIRFLQVKPD